MASKLSPAEVSEKIKGLSEWELADNAIRKEFIFGSFLPAVDFVNRVAPLAEDADHHPDIFINYRRVTMTLSTHSEGGLTVKDFDLAKKIDQIANA